MAKVSAVERDKKRRRLADRYAERRAALKAIVMDRNAAPEERFAAQLKLAQLPRNSARNRVRNRCNLSGRSRAYYRQFGLSRLALRDLGSKGQIPGLVKSSW